MQSKAISMPIAIVVVAVVLIGIIAVGVRYANRPNISQADAEKAAKMGQMRQHTK